MLILDLTHMFHIAGMVSTIFDDGHLVYVIDVIIYSKSALSII